jgi:ABC-type Fe3+-citrate transport system substrate-binding protein
LPPYYHFEYNLESEVIMLACPVGLNLDLFPAFFPQGIDYYVIQPLNSMAGVGYAHYLLRALESGIQFILLCRNMAEGEPVTYPRISIEEVIARQPEVILISSMERGRRFEEARDSWFQWASIPAVRHGRVHLIDSDLIDRPSPRRVDGLEIMAKLLHPELEWP